MLRSLSHIFLLTWILLCSGTSFGTPVNALSNRVAAHALSVPDDFLVEVLTDTGAEYTAIAFSASGVVYIAEKNGRIWSWREGNGLLNLELDIQDEVYENGRRGVESMAVEDAGGRERLFLLYAVSDVDDSVEAGAFGRVSRYDLDDPTGAILENTRQVLLGNAYADGIPACSNARALGMLRLGRDGSLLIATSDAASTDQFDSGGLHPSCFGEGRLGNEEDIGAYRAQALTSLGGKVLRVDTENGHGLPSNPYYTGSGISTASKIWAYGLREPASVLTLDTNTTPDNPGVLVVADRGGRILEELNISEAQGANYGWPCVDGLEPSPDYQNGSLGNAFCSANERLTPSHWWHHQNAAFSNPVGLAGNQFGSLTLYEGDVYPSAYKGSYFYSDRSRGWLATASRGPNGELLDQQLFSVQAGIALDMQYNPHDHYVYFIDERAGTLARLRHKDEVEVVLLDSNPREVEVVGQGLYGEYFDEVDFTGDKLVRIDTLLSYAIFSGPEGDIYNSARWEGYLIPDYSEVYTIHVSYQEGIRFWMNDELLLDADEEDDGRDELDRVNRQFVSLKAGVPYRIKIEQALPNSEVRMGLAWNSASQPLALLSEEEIFYSIREGINLCMLASARASLSTTLSPFAAAENACDGNTDGDFLEGSVAVSQNEPLPYWEVDLGAIRDVDAISLWGRTDCCEASLSGAFIFVSDVPFREEGLGVLSQPGVSAYIVNALDDAQFSTPVGRPARYIRVQQPTESTLSLAEVDVRAGLGNLEGAPPASGLVSWWSFEEDTRDRRGTNDGVLRNGARIEPDSERQFVLDLDGESDWMEVPHTDRLNGTHALSYALWVKPDGLSDGVLVAKDEGERGQMWLGMNERFVLGRVENGSGEYEVQGFLPPLDEWSHIALVYAGDKLTLYVNGQLAEELSFAFSALFLNEAPVIIGRDIAGKVDDVVLYNSALDDIQLQELIGAVSNVTVEEVGSEAPLFESAVWSAVYPNPFYNQAYLHYTLPQSDIVRLDIFDSIGRRVRSYQTNHNVKGHHTVVWDGTDDAGREVRAGLYFVRLMVNETAVTSHLIKL